MLKENLVGLNGLEPSTSRLSGGRSNLLSYKPIFLDDTAFVIGFTLCPDRKPVQIYCRTSILVSISIFSDLLQNLYLSMR